MADSLTANIGMLIADPADVVQYAAHVGNNYTLADSMLGAVDCLSTARPTVTYKGQIVYERDSKRYAQNTASSAAPSWSYMSHQAMAVTAATRPTSGLTNGFLAYETDTGGLLAYNGGVWRYKSNISATSSARPDVPAGAMVIYETDTTRSMIYDGTVWKPVGASVMAVPVTTISSGTPGGSETLDSVLGVYKFNAVSGRRYEYRLNGLLGNGGASSDQYEIRIRDSESNSTPTTSSALCACTPWSCTTSGSSGRIPLAVAGTRVATVTGVHTVGVFSVRTAGTGSFTPLSSSVLGRELFVYDCGSN